MKRMNYCSILICILFWASVGRAQNSITKKQQLKYLPDIDVYDIHGKHTTLKQLGKNKVLFIDSWFIPCPPCFIEMGMLHKLYAKYLNNKDFCFITLCRTDSGVVKKFIAQDTSMANYVKSYQFFSERQDFKLPVYFIEGCDSKVNHVGKQLESFAPTDKTKCPDAQLDFVGYPTVTIFNKKGELILQKTGYDGNENVNMGDIESAIKPSLAAK
ncbi:redoxin family protein [Mucilaginibacter sabulilitoris]|uniref:Redoxin family protein n=1 Tax=Mucilaginibacter sabulilitoris TaxID=1173583 RepID=A0ABZ0TRT7_9SPHI|nr:redoxin family protein [Mucilaginibacter sabulilitoris]WPU95167.1 redoxin family protein [Mucilaginibacter sabulilitoris]